ncbi:hypothetical protein PENTCL1PPCAC_15803 [Pristionchus entomophagus]|uniref:Glutathione S-transferase n=1 Tax=Pristionchus entomophagus TaxID=358040 RepID=A0AAV5TH43_9BILA|nr:hypothetical protein PENTCL1PPCAC_15803 [Pristionchus entomophagus]
MARLQEPNFEKDVVYLFQFAGNDNVSSLSPYCVKVEAFCRVHNLKFERRNTTARGSNGLLPFIELNGAQISDSQLILNKLTEHFQLKNYADAHEEGLGYALERTIENHTMHLIRFDMSRVLPQFIRVMIGATCPGCLLPAVACIGGWFMRRKMHGVVRTTIGAFSDAEYDDMLKSDLLQLQNVLGDKQFIMGSTPSKVDCTALAHIGYAYYIMPQARSRIHELLESKELSSFKEYMDRVVATAFPDGFNDNKK